MLYVVSDMVQHRADPGTTAPIPKKSTAGELIARACVLALLPVPSNLTAAESLRWLISFALAFVREIFNRIVVIHTAHLVIHLPAAERWE